MQRDVLVRIETEIDDAFADNILARMPFAQAAWTLLSVLEEHNFKLNFIDRIAPEQLRAHVDVLVNAIAHPMLVCHRRCPVAAVQFPRKLMNAHYAAAQVWISAAEDYGRFCTLFSLAHAGEIELRCDGNELVPSDWRSLDLRYEAYDRFMEKGDPCNRPVFDGGTVQNSLARNVRVGRRTFAVDFRPSMIRPLAAYFRNAAAYRRSLPGTWRFARFTVGEFREVAASLQAMACAWFFARHVAASDGAQAMAFASALWTPKKTELLDLLVCHTGLRAATVESVLEYWTFGMMGVRNPDIAIQPIVDLGTGAYAVSSFVLMNVDTERNLCVLLNRIDRDRALYSRMVGEKEVVTRTEAMDSLSGLDLEFKWGPISSTDIDLAFIDHRTKRCLCSEIKWFIEPSEVREVRERSMELAKGIVQARKISEAYRCNDAQVMSVLGIDSSYDLRVLVASVNFIGGASVQHVDVPIVRLRHLVSEIRRRGGLGGIFEWLGSRDYLPRAGVDFKISPVDFKCGRWQASWYGIGLMGRESS